MCVFQIGKTKVFLRAGQMADLDARRSEVLGRSASIIQRKVRSYLAKRSFIAIRRAAIQLQAVCRGNWYISSFLHVEPYEPSTKAVNSFFKCS